MIEHLQFEKGKPGIWDMKLTGRLPARVESVQLKTGRGGVSPWGRVGGVSGGGVLSGLELVELGDSLLGVDLVQLGGLSLGNHPPLHLIPTSVSL